MVVFVAPIGSRLLLRRGCEGFHSSYGCSNRRTGSVDQSADDG